MLPAWLVTGPTTVILYVFYVIFYHDLEYAIWLYRPDIVDTSGRVGDLQELQNHFQDGYDVIVVGARTAGCVVANRLSEVKGWKVLLLKTGHDETLVGEVPAMMTTYQTTTTDWMYKTEPDPGYCRAMVDGRCTWHSGKVLGGTSAVNAMVYIRGNKRDYDKWECMGMRIGSLRDSPYHGAGGYLTVEDTAKAFLRPVKDHPNLDVSLVCHVECIIIDPFLKTVREVVFVKRGYRYHVPVHTEVIISAGVMNSPQILILSEIEPAKHLKELAISPVISDLKAGDNLEDNICTSGLVYSVEASLGTTLSNFLSFSELSDISSIADSPHYPDIVHYMSSMAENSDGGIIFKYMNGFTDDFYDKVYKPIAFRDSFTIWSCLMRPKSRGYLRLRSRNSKSPPLIYPKYMSHGDDVKVLMDGARFVKKLSKTSLVRKICAKLNPIKFLGCEHLEMMSDEYLECSLRAIL
ncbi:hypothetical protein PR048_029323 [Dryococelus australis]|uniref:Glucose-methanol-choline oxidoreductase N-terminal domain-containing protein n=1 Tax=Dryococelus australis TaxID=614101 RepID=A0ABQ9GDP7_9NEOP|nr:hypothetical protein PR048_029323 [Dryococelus australis]